ncbi:uncharacterized protein BJ171DRAFT_578927 [Polychytrium aggregatum]|uniref:uncharacterized protein n=1 Tax=Polychytrium aggregatum TaxID=110093 RepID=UPI0022FDCFEF|nr:uncharacterized protein BJ171DRAFT_578927 [Polychytrium aggregatum]KAI9207195.1 hypothetical protein BJ171DRAFT_578927 [Polychytrium aggregatum]
MSTSDDIIRHIIQDIVARSTTALKSRRDALATHYAEQLSDGNVGLSLHSIHPPLPMTPIPGAKHLFTSIHSHTQSTVITETLAAFMVRAVVLDPRHEFRIDQDLSRDEIAVELILSLNNPVMETVKMQVYFDTNFAAQAEFLHREKMVRINACAPILREITEVKTKSVSVYEVLYRRIVSYIMIRSHVGNPMDIRVVREATAALESVFPQSELSTFISLGRAEKEAQLNGLSQLVTGIRLFNKHLGKGGEYIESLPEICNEELMDLSNLIDKFTKETETLIRLYTAIIDYMEKTPQPVMGMLTPARVKSALVFRRQYLMYLDALQEQAKYSRSTLGSLNDKHDQTIHDLRATCKSKTAVPVDQVYPQFIMLANLWNCWLDELFLLAFRRGILDTIDYHSKDSWRPVLALAESNIISVATELMVIVSAIHKSIEVVHPGNTTHYYRLPVEFGGYCPYTLVKRDGLVSNGNRNIGLLKYRDRLYALVSIEAAKEFSKFPDRYIEGVLETAKRSPDLVQLLHLYNYFPTVEALESAKSFTRQRLLGQMPLVADASTQVDTHIVDHHVDLRYKWNEWDLRRQGLMLVNLRNKVTKSMQTDVSVFRRESETQHYEPKTQTTQTYTESATNVPRKVNYVAGLRGKPGTYKSTFKVVDLTLDL